MNVGVGEDGFTFSDREAAIRGYVERKRLHGRHGYFGNLPVDDIEWLLAELAAAREREAVAIARMEDAENDAANARSSRDELVEEARAELAAAREREEAALRAERSLRAILEHAGKREERLREALRTICEIGETRDVEVARAALSEGQQ